MWLGKIINNKTLPAANCEVLGQAAEVYWPKANNTGFTLVEVLAAISILLLVVVLALSFFPFGLQSAVSTSQKTTALYLAQAKIEEIISTSYANLTTGQTNENSLAGLGNDFAAYSRTAMLTYVDGNLNVSASNLGLIKVEVKVSWLDSLKKNTLNTVLTTLVTDL